MQVVCTTLETFGPVTFKEAELCNDLVRYHQVQYNKAQGVINDRVMALGRNAK